MGKWAYLAMSWSTGGIYIRSSEDIDFGWVKEQMPSARIEPFRSWPNPTSQPRGYSYVIHKLSGHDAEIALNIIKYLGEKDWEPFAVVGRCDVTYPSTYYEGELHFKRHISDSES